MADQVLHDEDPDRDAAVEGAKLALLLERLRHHHGAGEPEGAGDEQGGHPAGAEPVDDEDAEERGGHREMEERGAPDLGAHDVAQAHLHPHREQHEQHAGVRDGLETAGCGEPGRVEGESRREKADERRHAERAGGEAQDERAGDVDPDHGQPPALRYRQRVCADHRRGLPSLQDRESCVSDRRGMWRPSRESRASPASPMRGQACPLDHLNPGEIAGLRPGGTPVGTRHLDRVGSPGIGEPCGPSAHMEAVLRRAEPAQASPVGPGLPGRLS